MVYILGFNQFQGPELIVVSAPQYVDGDSFCTGAVSPVQEPPYHQQRQNRYVDDTFTFRTPVEI